MASIVLTEKQKVNKECHKMLTESIKLKRLCKIPDSRIAELVGITKQAVGCQLNGKSRFSIEVYVAIKWLAENEYEIEMDMFN